jgi:hypothetical protein
MLGFATVLAPSEYVMDGSFSARWQFPATRLTTAVQEVTTTGAFAVSELLLSIRKGG